MTTTNNKENDMTTTPASLIDGARYEFADGVGFVVRDANLNGCAVIDISGQPTNTFVRLTSPMFVGAKQISDWTLFDGDTAEPIGPATPDQIEASDEAGETGLILIDADGDVVVDGTWEAKQPGVRKVYVA